MPGAPVLRGQRRAVFGGVADRYGALDPTEDSVPWRDGSPYALDILRVGDAPAGTVAELTCRSSTYLWGSQGLAALGSCKP